MRESTSELMLDHMFCWMKWIIVVENWIRYYNLSRSTHDEPLNQYPCFPLHLLAPLLSYLSPRPSVLFDKLEIESGQRDQRLNGFHMDVLEVFMASKVSLLLFSLFNFFFFPSFLFCFVLFCFVLFCFVLFCFVLFCFMC